jgi:hypothetical protein
MSSVPASSSDDDGDARLNGVVGQEAMRTARRRHLKRVASSSGNSDSDGIGGNKDGVDGDDAVDGLASETDGNASNAGEAVDDGDNENENEDDGNENENGDGEDDVDDENGGDDDEDDDDEEEDLPSDREIDRIERMAEKLRRKDPVRR